MLRLIFGLGISFISSVWSLGHLGQDRATEHRNLAAPPNEIKYFTLGFSNAMADSFWLRVIQDMDYCGGINLTEVDWSKTDKVVPTCNDGWVSKMFDLITDLSRDFYLVYRVGITALPILVRDKQGAEKFIQKATRQYPKDWTIAYRSAYFYIFEKKDTLRAAELLKIAGENGAPEWVLSLSARLYDEAGQLLLGISVLEDTLKTTKDEYFKKHLIKKIKEYTERLKQLKK